MFEITIDDRGYDTKPEKKEVGKISRRMSVAPVDDLRKMADFISNRGYTWCPAVFNGTRKMDNFISTQFIALDFDGGVSFDEIYVRSKKYMLPILFAYETFSSVNMSKFRIVFVLDKCISDISTFNLTIAAFMKIFNECDAACKDAARMFFGGKRLIHYNENEYKVDINNLMMNFSLYLKDRYGETHYKAYIKKFISNHMPKNENGKNLPFVVYNRTRNGKKLHKYHKEYRSDVLDRLSDICRLYMEFVEDSKWLYYNDLYGIATNLIHVDKGKQLFLEHITSSQYDTYKKDWKFYLKYFQDNEYLPMRCEKFCPYCNECPHGNNMLDSAKVKRKEIIRVNTPEYVSIEDVQQELYIAFDDAMSSYDNKIHVIKAQTAIGKTRMYIDYLRGSQVPCIIAVPTNQLKHEVYYECINNGIEVMETPSIQELRIFMPNDMDYYIDELYNTGRYNMVIPYIISKIEEMPYLRNYIKALEEVKKFNGHIITTHQKILYSNEELLKKYKIIIDEDILKTMIKNQISVEISDIEDLLKESLPDMVRKHLINIIELSENQSLFSVLPIGNWGVMANFNLNALLNADKFHSDGRTISFYQTPNLKNIKYTVLSATVDEYIYKNYFGSDRVIFYTCSTAKYKGKLLQYFDHSYSRRYIDDNDHVYEDIKKITGDVPRITFKKYSSYDDIIHFGNSEGCNFMQGQDIAVIGTPHVADFLYKLLAYQMGYDGNDELRYREVMYNGYKFWFYTYENELLRRVQFWMIESELEQSVGRARLLRNDCTVWLFSDFPLEQSELCESTIT